MCVDLYIHVETFVHQITYMCELSRISMNTHYTSRILYSWVIKCACLSFYWFYSRRMNGCDNSNIFTTIIINSMLLQSTFDDGLQITFIPMVMNQHTTKMNVLIRWYGTHTHMRRRDTCIITFFGFNICNWIINCEWAFDIWNTSNGNVDQTDRFEFMILFTSYFNGLNDRKMIKYRLAICYFV